MKPAQTYGLLICHDRVAKNQILGGAHDRRRRLAVCAVGRDYCPTDIFPSGGGDKPLGTFSRSGQRVLFFADWRTAYAVTMALLAGNDFLVADDTRVCNLRDSFFVLSLRLLRDVVDGCFSAARPS